MQEALGLIFGQETRFHMPQLRLRQPQLTTPHAPVKIKDPVCWNKDSLQPNKYIDKKKLAQLKNKAMSFIIGISIKDQV